MADIAQATEYLQSLLNSPLLEADPVYQELKGEGVTRILKMAALSRGYLSFNSVPETELPLIFLIARRELFLALSTQVAPEYDVETEFTKLLKSKRFDHYIRLVTEVSAIIQEQSALGLLSSVTSGNVVIGARDGGRRNYALAKEQEVTLTVSPASSTANIDWSRFDTSVGSFSHYRLLVGNNLYDPYADTPIQQGNALFSQLFYDIDRTKYRIMGLTPDTGYEVLIELVAQSRKVSIEVVAFRTLI